MEKQPPHFVYRSLCQRLRQRIEFAEQVIGSTAPHWHIAETASLQGRKAIETISHMCLVAVEHGLGELGIPRDAKKHWNAETIFNRLKKKGINTLPSPSRMQKSTDPRWGSEFVGVPENRLSYDDLCEIYGSFHEHLHDINPYAVDASEDYYIEKIPVLSKSIDRIRRFAWIHFAGIKGQAFLVDLKNEYGITAVVPMSKKSDVPTDLP